MVKANKDSLGKGAAFIYIELTIAALSGYVLWIFLSRITTPDVIGVGSTAISIAIMFTSITSMGLPNSITRHIGKTISDERVEEAKLFLKSSLLLSCISIFACSLIILLLKDHWILKNLGFDLIILTIVLMGASNIATLFRHAIIASFRSKTLVSRQISASIVKIVLSVLLILVGAGGLGLVVGHAASQIVALIVMSFTIIEIFKSSSAKSRITITQACKSVFVGGIPSWIPASVTAIGAQLGPVVVFGTSGAHQAGTYFIAFSILSAVIIIGTSLLTSAFPVLSALVHGRKRLSWRIIKMSLVISVPISSSFIFYSAEILGLIGREYVQSSFALQILLLSVFPVLVSMGVNTLVYSYGNYRQVLSIGLATSIPRTLLYFVTVPLYDGTGAAISYTAGSLIGFIFSVVVAKQVGLVLFWKDLFLILCIPSGIAFILSYFQVSFVIGIVATLIITYVLLIRMRILAKTDVEDSTTMMPPKLSRLTMKLLDVIGNKKKL
jgi:O-antigen/teichoic acid export membrane protein